MKIEDKYQIVLIGCVCSTIIAVTAIWALWDSFDREYKHFVHEKIMLERLLELEIDPIKQKAWQAALEAINQYFEDLSITK